MKFRISFIILFLMLSFSCRKKIADDYIYYQPYKRAKVSIKDTISSTPSKDSVQFKKNTVEDIKPVNLNDKYFIVVASYSVEEYAITMKHDLLKQGYKPEIFMLKDDGWNKVAILSFNNYEEAIQELEKIKLKGDLFSGARIVIK
jgi:cell division protein FtsN